MNETSNQRETPSGSDADHGMFRRHLLYGWWSLLLFLTVGIFLESLHGFKVAWYINVGEETRRLTWRLAHAHGTLLSLVHLAFAWTASRVAGASADARRMASPCLLGASILIPGGFFLGGVKIHGGDPGMGIALLPVGAVLLLVSVLLTGLALNSRLKR